MIPNVVHTARDDVTCLMPEPRPPASSASSQRESGQEIPSSAAGTQAACCVAAAACGSSAALGMTSIRGPATADCSWTTAQPVVPSMTIAACCDFRLRIRERARRVWRRWRGVQGVISRRGGRRGHGWTRFCRGGHLWPACVTCRGRCTRFVSWRRSCVATPPGRRPPRRGVARITRVQPLFLSGCGPIPLN